MRGRRQGKAGSRGLRHGAGRRSGQGLGEDEARRPRHSVAMGMASWRGLQSYPRPLPWPLDPQRKPRAARSLATKSEKVLTQLPKKSVERSSTSMSS